MAGPRGLERLTAQDLLMLWADDFGWSEDIGVLAVLDGARLLAGDGRVRVTETAARKGRARPAMGGGLFGLVAVQRAWYRLLTRQRRVNLVVTNVPGPPVPLYRAGARLLELFPVAATMGNLTLAVAVLSYAASSTSPRSPTGTPAPTWRCSSRACGPPSKTSSGRSAILGPCAGTCCSGSRERQDGVRGEPLVPWPGGSSFPGWHERCGR